MHGLAMVTCGGVAVVGHAAWPVAVGIVASLAVLIVGATGRFTPAGGFGPANTLTLFRLLSLVAAILLLSGLAQPVLLSILVGAFVLDALDGFVARRLHCASDFGATFDAETDAILVLVLGLVLWLRKGTGVWVLAPGALRYFYVLTLALFPPRRARPWRTRLGRLVFLLGTTLLLVALFLPGTASDASAALAALLFAASFVRSLLAAYPRPWQVPTWAQRAWRFTSPTMFFLFAWSFLNVMINLRYPGSEPRAWYFLPSLDVTILFAALALLGLVGWRLPWGARVPLVVAVIVIRALRIGDGVTGYYFGKLFNLYTDLPLTPELIRYAHSTFAAWKFYAGALAALAAVALLVLLVDRALGYAANYFTRRRRILIFLGLAAPFAIASPFLTYDSRYNQRYAGAFGASVWPRLQHEALFLINVVDHRQAGMAAIGRTQEVLRHTPSGLERLHHANVYLIFVESYGVTVLDRESFAKRALPALKTMQADLTRAGFTSASGVMDSATYGGMSWLAHATLFTGVRTSDQLQYDLLGVSHPKSLARIAREAGYHTILVQPNTNRPSHTADFYDFDETFKLWDFDYAGPAFAWAAMPDQYALDFIHRHVIAKYPRPLFVSYALVSSHAPWSHVPTMVADWSKIGNGSVYNDLPFKRAYTNWPNFTNAAEPYLDSILYDLQVLDSYLTSFIDDDSLVILLGDHQPVSEITEDSLSWAVPVHVISRDANLVAPFVAHGYASGMIPNRNSNSPMEAFLADFLRAFSTGAS
jgi:phosphatidylglycerophosphate synthase